MQLVYLTVHINIGNFIYLLTLVKTAHHKRPFHPPHLATLLLDTVKISTYVISK